MILGRPLTMMLLTRCRNVLTKPLPHKMVLRKSHWPARIRLSIVSSIANRANICRCLRWQHYSSYNSKKVNLVTPVFLQAENFLDRVAIVDENGQYTYSDLLHATNKLTNRLCSELNADKGDLGSERVAFLCPNNASYVVAQWACWMSGGVAVALSPAYPPSELSYFLEDSQCKVVMVTEEMLPLIKEVAVALSIKILVLGEEDFPSGNVQYSTEVSDSRHNAEDPVATTNDQGVPASDITAPGDSTEANRKNRLGQLHKYNKFKKRDALIVYTSGSTGKPKGVVHTHGSLQAQMTGMISVWGWTASDVILHTLPLHHVHGIVNALMTPLFCGATCVLLPKFDAKKVWSMLLSPLSKTNLPRSINIFMAVPTMYAKLIDNYNKRLDRGRGTRQAREYVKAMCTSKIRLMVSGSAALPQPVMESWEEITGHKLLERYGMTEIGMALTNPLHGARVPGSVGVPFPGVEVAVATPNAYSKTGYNIIAQGDCQRTKILPGCEEKEGELLVRGPNVFKSYWQKPEATAESFTEDGWFKTGDTACYMNGSYRILGRTSVDIIKSGGYKLSALDIERHLLAHPDITDVAVVGLPDITWGQKVAAVLVLRDGAEELSLTGLRKWAGEVMPAYQMPSVLKVLGAMPRNAMGKVNKKQLLTAVFSKELKANGPV